MNVLHLGVYALIKREEEILLIKKLRGPYTGKLDLPGGRVEHGETPEQTVKREVAEETGLVVLESKLLNNLSVKVDFKDDRGDVSMHQIGLIYQVTVGENQTPIAEMEMEDSGGAEWFEIKNLTKDGLSPFAATLLGYE